MIPKVATQILHTTSRAAAAVHNQTSTLRNVFQLQTSSGTSTAAGTGPWNGNGSSSRGNSHGPGPGGSKQNTGSRFYAGFTVSHSLAFLSPGLTYHGCIQGPVRAVTQANAVTSQDGTFVQHDDNQEEQAVSPRRVSLRASKGHRIRSSSLSMSRVETLGVLKTVQIHARSRHAFAHAQGGNDTAKTPRAVTRKSIQHSRRLIARRNSTSTQAPDSTSIDLNSTYAVSDELSVDPASVPLPASPSASTVDLSNTDLSTEQPPQHLPEQNADDFPLPSDPAESSAYAALKDARDSNDPGIVADAVRHFRQTAQKPTVREFNMALEAILQTRTAGEPLTFMLETYHDLIRCQIIPTVQTYDCLIRGLADRDFEVQWFIRDIQARQERQATLTGGFETGNVSGNQQKIATLKEEENFSGAMGLLESVLSVKGGSKLSARAYIALLRICAIRGDATQAMRIFSLLGKLPNSQLPPSAYRYTIQAYANAGDIQDAEQVFYEFRSMCKDSPEKLDWQMEDAEDQRKILVVWNQMIEGYFQVGMPEKAVGLVEEMLRKSADDFDVPYPSSMTYTSILNGFCSSGDIETALVWFNKLLEQSEAPGSDPLLQKEMAVRPDHVAWITILEALAKHNMVDELNNTFERMLLNDDIDLHLLHRSVVFVANMKRLPTLDAAHAEHALTFLLDKVILPNTTEGKYLVMYKQMEKTCIDHGLYELAARAMTLSIDNTLLPFRRNGREPPEQVKTLAGIHFAKFSELLYGSSESNIPFDLVIKLCQYADNIGCKRLFPPSQIPAILHSYGLARSAGALPEDIKLNQWIMLLNAVVQLQATTMGGYRHVYVAKPDDAFPGIVSLVEDMEARGFKLAELDEQLINRVLRVAFFQSGMEDLNAILSRLGPKYNRMLEELQGLDPSSPLSVYTLTPDEQMTHTSSPTLAPESASDGAFPIPSSKDVTAQKLLFDGDLSATIRKILFRHTAQQLPKACDAAYVLLMDGISVGRIPTFSTIGLLIENLGRSSNSELMGKVYTTAHEAFKPYARDKGIQSAWFDIENSMIIGLAHSGDVETAHAYRRRILDNGGVPSADAYGILIHTVKDTTDDTSNAMALFEEAMQLKVTPNLYLYNTIISKLAKARKTDYALQLFREMGSRSIRPSSITYGAVIGACARVGDLQSAENLFAEMESARNFKPRVPPYNTMMQMYTTTKPNRERALFYYNKLRRAKIAPTAYTYKVFFFISDCSQRC